jgi:glycosyltransferase involved in cell wall biosynthesis
MNIAIQAADLDDARIDGTRVYLMQLLRRFGSIAPEHAWHLYHRGEFNSELAPPELPNYVIHQVSAPAYWTQTRFAWEMWRLKPNHLFMPVQTLPFWLPGKVRTTVTIHDLAFKFFPNHFPERDVRRLNWFTDYAVQYADKLIAVSEATKKDILAHYPDVSEDKIRVIYHGFDGTLFGRPAPADILTRFRIRPRNYLLYVGAIQPRKNLTVLFEAFERVKKIYPEAQLVLAGEKAWLWEDILKEVERYSFGEDIIFTGKVSFQDLAALYQNARMFIFASLYEGFGIPVLEAMASGTPVICANNSSLPEVGDAAVLYFDALNVLELTTHIRTLWEDSMISQALVTKGREHIQRFSWDKCAQETLEWILA